MLIPRWILGVTLIWSATALAAPVAAPLPPQLADLKPTSVLPPDARQGFEVRNNSGVRDGLTVTWLDSEHAVRLENRVGGKSPGSMAAVWVAPQPVAARDVCWVRFYARATQARQETGEGTLDFSVGRHPTGERHVLVTLGIGPEWTLFEVPFTASLSTAAGESAVVMGVGALQQTIEISGLEFFNFGTRAIVQALPSTRFTYAGREPGAAWRKEALARIERIRTAPLQVKVADAQGTPLAGARVHVRLVQPAFQWGSAVSIIDILGDSPDADIYRRKVVELFDTVTIDNALKWPSWIRAREDALRAVDWINAQGLRLRGHNLVWPGWKFAPRVAIDMPAPKSELRALVEQHIRDEAAATKGKVIAWDVINEPLHERDFFNHMPEEAVVDWFKLTREIDPAARLFVNEYAMLNSPTSPAFIQKFIAWSERMRSLGAPIDALGVQGHVGRQMRRPVDVLSDLDLFNTCGFPVQITEFDINTPDDELQADYFRDFLIACYSHPVVDGFIMWGFWQSRHWKPDAAMYRPDWSEKPNAKVWQELVLKQWRTNTNGLTDASGATHARGHLGRYEVTVTRGDRKATRTIDLGAKGAEVSVTLP